MPSKIPDSLIDDAYQLMLDGHNLTSASKLVGVYPDIVSKRIRSRGLEIPKTKQRAHNRQDIPLEQIVSRIDAGMSVKAIAEELNTSRNVITRILNEAGIQQPNRSEAMFIRMSKTTGQERQQITRAAHDAVRGKSQSFDHRCKIAVARCINQTEYFFGPGEKEFKEILADRGIEAVGQFPCEIYNIDFLVMGNVAVELTRTWQSRFISRPDQLNRFKKFAEHNIRTVGVAFRSVESLLRNIDDVIANIHQVSSDESFIGKHRVIRCTFENFTRFRDKRGKFAAKRVPKRFLSTVEDIQW